jgi:hypothetical protein
MSRIRVVAPNSASRWAAILRSASSDRFPAFTLKYRSNASFSVIVAFVTGAACSPRRGAISAAAVNASASVSNSRRTRAGTDPGGCA